MDNKKNATQENNAVQVLNGKNEIEALFAVDYTKIKTSEQAVRVYNSMEGVGDTINLMKAKLMYTVKTNKAYTGYKSFDEFYKDAPFYLKKSQAYNYVKVGEFVKADGISTLFDQYSNDGRGFRFTALVNLIEIASTYTTNKKPSALFNMICALIKVHKLGGATPNAEINKLRNCLNPFDSEESTADNPAEKPENNPESTADTHAEKPENKPESKPESKPEKADNVEVPRALLVEVRDLLTHLNKDENPDIIAVLSKIFKLL